MSEASNEPRLPVFAVICAAYILAYGMWGLVAGGLTFEGMRLLGPLAGAAYVVSGALLLARRKPGLYLYSLTLIAIIAAAVATSDNVGQTLPQFILPVAVAAYLGTPSVRAALK